MSTVNRTLRATDTVVRGNVLSAFEPSDVTPGSITVDAVLSIAAKSPYVAARLLDCPGDILYAGPHASHAVTGGTLGVTFADGGTLAVGANVYGRVLMEARDRLLASVNEGVQPLVAQRPGQVVFRYTEPSAGAEDASAPEVIDMRPLDRRAAWRDVDRRDGTTGHSGLPSGDASFQTWRCPFGTDASFPVRVGSAAEASLLFEKGLRGELDTRSLVASLRSRGLMPPSVRSREAVSLMESVQAQFAWMRASIASDGQRLSRLPIVAGSPMVPDASFGRSLHDPLLAPSPADVLAHYINNPLLLRRRGYSLVALAVDGMDRGEAYRFTPSGGGGGSVDIIVDGSDTVGGRVPGTRAVRTSGSRRGRDASYEMQFKTAAETERDYAAFAARLDSVLSSLPSDIHVRFLTSSGVGTPAMVRRYVLDRGGGVSDWSYREHRAVAAGRGPVSPDARFSVLRFRDFPSVLPVLAGSEPDATFVPRDPEDGKEVTFACPDGISPQAAVVFTVSEDPHDGETRRRGGLLASAGLPVVAVEGIEDEDAQEARLAAGLADSGDLLLGLPGEPDQSLFRDDNTAVWDREACVPVFDELFREWPSPVYVCGEGFRSVHSAYLALLLRAAGKGYSGDMHAVAALTPEESMARAAAVSVSGSVRERCMRGALHSVARANAGLSDFLFSTGGRLLYVPAPAVPDADGNTVGSQLSADARTALEATLAGGDMSLFVGSDGHGLNRWGLVLMAERDAVAARYRAENEAAEAVAREVADENARLHRRMGTVRAAGEKVEGGVPRTPEEAEGAVWFLGTSEGLGLSLPDGSESVQEWVQEGSGDYLCRELASRDRLDDGAGGYVPNSYVFLFPTDRMAATGRRHVTDYADGRDLTGVRRVNPATGRSFTCAFGIPVRHDERSFEPGNVQGRHSSFLTDQDAAGLVLDMQNAHVRAAVTAMQEGMSLCYARMARPRVASVTRTVDPVTLRETVSRSEEPNDDLSRVFGAVVWDFPRVPASAPVIADGRYEGQPGSIIPFRQRRMVTDPDGSVREVTDEVFRKDWVPSPHAAPRLKAVTQRYLGFLRQQAHLPLHCLRLPREDYSDVPEEVFMADFAFTLGICNAMAAALDVPMRFPLGPDGHLDLGPGVPPACAALAERRLDSYIGVVRPSEAAADLPVLTRVSLSDTAPGGGNRLSGDGTDVYLRPTQLMDAFGPFDFGYILSGQVAPMHEMAFAEEAYDGDTVTRSFFRLTDPRLSTSLSMGEQNRYISYSRNDECRFRVTASDPSRIPAFAAAVRAYVARAARVSVDCELVAEEQADAAGLELGLAGYVDLLPSDSRALAREGQQAPRGDLTAVDLPSRFDGNEREAEDNFFGHRPAGDGFRGWVRYTAALPDGTQVSGIVEDRELALLLVLSRTQRVVSSDTVVVPERRVLDSMLRSYAIRENVTAFRSPAQRVGNPVAVDRKVSIGRSAGAPAAETAAAPETVRAASAPNMSVPGDKACGRVFVTYYGSRSVPAPGKALYVQISSSCPKGMEGDMDVFFDSLYPDYRTMVKAHKDGIIDDAGYASRYEENVLGPNAGKILSGMRKCISMAEGRRQDVYLFCYEKPGQFCHRYLVANFLRSLNIDCRENPADRRTYSVGAVPLSWETEGAPLKERGDFTYASLTARRREGEAAAAADAVVQPKVYLAPYGERGDIHPNDFVIVTSPTDDAALEARADAFFDSIYPSAEADAAPDGTAARNAYVRQMLPVLDDVCQKLRGACDAAAGRSVVLVDGGREGSFQPIGPLSEILSESGFDVLPMDFRPMEPQMTFTVSEGGYQQRTRENAAAAGVTVQFAADFTTYGEKSTASAASGRCVPVELPVRDGRLDLSPEAVLTAARAVLDGCRRFPSPVRVNIAGNGMHTLASKGISQDDLDVFVTAVFHAAMQEGLEVSSLLSGGQTGADEAAASVSAVLSLPLEVHAPAGWQYRPEDGRDRRGEEAFRARFQRDRSDVQSRAGKLMCKVDALREARNKDEVRKPASSLRK